MCASINPHAVWHRKTNSVCLLLFVVVDVVHERRTSRRVRYTKTHPVFLLHDPFCRSEPPRRMHTYSYVSYATQQQQQQQGDVNPKDFILFSPDDFAVVHTWKDNTGRREYREGMVFPTLEFPSDHGVLSVTLAKV